MASEKLLSTSKIIWCDPSVTNEENRSYIKALTDLKYSLENFHSAEDTANFLKANPLRKYIIITAGSTGHDLLKRIESLNNIIGVVVFCYDKAKHLKWAKNYQQVKNVTTSINVLVEEVNKISKNFLLLGALETATGSDYEIAKGILNGNNISGTTEMVEYFHLKTEKVMDFKLTSILLKVSPTPSEVLEELLAFKTTPDSEKEIKNIFQDYEQPSFNLLKAFCYLYSTDLIYSQFTRACASKSYMKVIKTIKATLNKLRDQPTRVFQNNTKLYRGVKKVWITPEEYKDKKGFWPSFTSTSQDEAIAKKFAGPQGIIFVISLSEQSTHPNIIIDEGWSKFPIEKEVLLLPYFPLKTTSITEKDGYTYIHVKQNEEDSVLSLENDDLWPLKIELGIYIGLEEKFYEIYESFCSALTIESVVGNMSFAMAVLEVAVNEIKQAHESELFNNLLLRLSNSSEEIYKNLEERLSNRLKDTIPEIIKRHIEERICSLYEQTNSQIDKIVAEEALGTQDLHTQLNNRLLKGLTEVLNTWITLKKEITVQGMLNPLASVLATEIVKEIGAGNIIELDSVNVVSIFSKTLKSDKIKLKPEVNSVLQEICTKKQECYTHIDQCNQELFNEYKRILDDIKLMLKKRIKHLIFEAN